MGFGTPSYTLEEHGAEKHTNVTREVFLPVYGTIVGEGAVRDIADEMNAVKFPDGVVSRTHLTFKVPDDFVSFVSLKLIWVAYVTSGDMSWKVAINYRAEGELYNGGGTEDSGYSITSTGGNDILNVQEHPNPPSFVNLEKEDYVGIRVERGGERVEDTINDDVWIVGVLFTYIAEQ